MAIAVRKDGNKLYVSGTGSVTDKERSKADELDEVLESGFKKLEHEFIEEGLLTKDGVKKDALQIWYRIGKLLNEIGDNYGVFGTTDEPYYWQAVYDHVSDLIQKGEAPKRSKDTRRNHFRLCGYMARKDWDSVRNVGNWATWRDLLDNIKLQEDPRVFDWVVSALKDSGLSHKQVRPFVHEVRRTIKNKDTRFLTDDELNAKLVGLKTLLKPKQEREQG